MRHESANGLEDGVAFPNGAFRRPFRRVAVASAVGFASRTALAAAFAVALFFLGVSFVAPVALAQGYTPPSAPMGTVVTETRTQVAPGIVHLRRTTDAPLHINVLTIDVRQPGIEFRTCLSNDTVTGIETVRSMAARTGAVVAVNGDYWTHGGIPLGLTIVDGEVVVAPKCRTAFGVRWDGTPVIRRASDSWTWQARVRAPNDEDREIVLLNSDCNENWLTLYSHAYGQPSRGNTVAPVTEVVLNMEHRVLDVRENLPGVAIPRGGYVLTGRGDAGRWLSANLKVGDLARLDLTSTPPWQEFKQAIGAGPRILQNGEFFADPFDEFPVGEEFTRAWKRGHYLNQYPRTAIGVSKDASTVVLVVVDGRMPKFSVGVYPKQMAELLREFGAWDGMDLDSGGSSTMVIGGRVVNHPSDRANADGTGGVERRVANGLLVFYNDPATGTGREPAPGTIGDGVGVGDANP